MRARWGFAVSILLVTAVVPKRARGGDDISVADALEVQAGQCVDKDSLVSQVSTWLGRGTVDARFRVNVIASEGDLDTTFVVQRNKSTIGERRIRSTSMTCAEFRAALGLAIATAIDAGIVEEKKPAVVPAAATAPPATVVAPPQPLRETPRPGPIPPPPSTLRIGIGADAIFAGGLLVNGAGGVAPAIQASIARWLDVRVGAVIASTFAPAKLSNGNVSQTLIAATIEGCIVQNLWHMQFRSCPGVWLGDIAATGAGFGQSLASDAFYSAFAVRFDARIPRDAPISAVVGFVPIVPLGKWGVEAEGRPSETRMTPPAAIAATMGLQMRIY